MQSSKYRYRLVTAPGGLFSPQRSPMGIERWADTHFLPVATKEDGIKDIERMVANDDFVPEVVEL